MLKLNWNPKLSEWKPTSYNNSILFSYNNLNDIFDKESVNIHVTIGLKSKHYPTAKNFEHNLWLDLPLESDIDRLSEPFQLTEESGVAEFNYSKKPLIKGDEINGTLRYVYPIFSYTNLSFRAGLTVHAHKGTWSSLPHRFEREEILCSYPVPFFEKFAYITDPEGGEGIQTRIGHFYKVKDGNLRYSWVNDLVSIHDKNIASIPLGSHAVTGGPGVRLAYFWVYADCNNLRGREKFEDGDTPD